MTAAGAKKSGKAVLLLGHGSKAKEANDTLRDIAGKVKEAGGYGCVKAAFLQMESPDFQEGFDCLASRGYDDIIVMPYFLYSGLHVTKDLPEEIEKAKERYPGVNVTITRSLGYHDKLVDITVERIEEAEKRAPMAESPFAQHPIEKESFRLIGRELDESPFSPLELPVVKRVIHSTADFEFKDLLRFSPGAIEAGVTAIRGGKNIVTDVKMIEAGVTRGRLNPFGARVLCFSSDRDVSRLAAGEGLTKTAASMRKAAPYMDGAVVAVGNAPTALFEVIELVKKGLAKPALVVGVPVGFVGAAESKEALMASSIPYISVYGRKGGSTVAVAIVNAIAILAGAAEGANQVI